MKYTYIFISLALLCSTFTFAQVRVNNGELGVGPVNPIAKLEVEGDIVLDDGNPDLIFYNDANRLGTIEFLSDVNMWISNEENGPMNFETNNTLQMTLTNTGRLGLGVSNPAQDLDILDDNCFVNLRASSGYAGVIIDKFNSAQNGYIIYRTGGSGFWYAGLMGTNDYSISRSPAADGSFYIEDATGDVGIGTTNPAYDLQVIGNVDISGIITGVSDAKIKKDVMAIESALQKIKKLNPVSYNFRCEDYPDMKLSTSRNMGLIAQEVESILPELVSSNGAAKNAQGEMVDIKSVNYVGLIPLMVKSIQELEAEVAKKDEQIELLISQLENRISDLENK